MSTVGILGGGQLGLMLAQAAHALGHRVVVLAPRGDNVAFREANVRIEGPYDDQGTLNMFIKELKGGPVMLEFENVPLETLRYLKRLRVRVCPDERALAVAQDRTQEKRLAGELGVPVGPYFCMLASQVPAESEVRYLFPGILKTARMGYDGLGQTRVENYQELLDAAKELSNRAVVLERVVQFHYEMSVIMARKANDDVRFFPSTRNKHKGGILRETYYREDCIPWAVRLWAQKYTRRLARHLEVVGLLAVEFFITHNQDVLFNEMAPRPHNSGHWTIEGCKTSQFTAYIQAVTGAPFTPIEPQEGMRMVNFIGREIERAKKYERQGASVHIYGKSEVRPGRKMGHMTFPDDKEKS